MVFDGEFRFAPPEWVRSAWCNRENMLLIERNSGAGVRRARGGQVIAGREQENRRRLSLAGWRAAAQLVEEIQQEGEARAAGIFRRRLRGEHGDALAVGV